MVMKNFLSANWIRIKLSHYTSGRTINAEWQESTPNKMTEFLRFSLDTDEVLAIVSGELLQCKIYETGGTEIARESRGLVTALAKRQTLPKEIVEFVYPYDITWSNQLSEISKDELKILLPSDMPFLVFDPGSSLIFNILSTSTIPATPHADTRWSYHAYLFDGSYSRYTELKGKGLLPAPGVDILREELKELRINRQGTLLER